MNAKELVEKALGHKISNEELKAFARGIITIVNRSESIIELEKANKEMPKPWEPKTGWQTLKELTRTEYVEEDHRIADTRDCILLYAEGEGMAYKVIQSTEEHIDKLLQEFKEHRTMTLPSFYRPSVDVIKPYSVVKTRPERGLIKTWKYEEVEASKQQENSLPSEEE